MTKTREYRTRDDEREQWGPGPWRDEPDKVQWQDEATGLPCLIVRNRVGALCGYVGVPADHPAYEVGYDDVRVRNGGDEDGWPLVHGGLTYSAHCQHGDEDHAICHVPAPGEPDDVWWLGFDCAHSGDYCPGMRALYRNDDRFTRFEEGYEDDVEHGVLRHRLGDGYWVDTYKTVNFVKVECAALARQLAA